jgi:hypothetical protein
MSATTLANRTIPTLRWYSYLTLHQFLFDKHNTTSRGQKWTNVDSDEETKYLTVYNYTVFITTEVLRRPLISNEDSRKKLQLLSRSKFLQLSRNPKVPYSAKTVHQWTLSRIQSAQPRSWTFILTLSSQLYARIVSQTASSLQICRFKFCAHF